MQFGGVRAVDDAVASTARPARITSLIGPNGAGKTTALNMLSGFYRASAGGFALGGSALRGRSAWRDRARRRRAHLPDLAALRQPERAKTTSRWRLRRGRSARCSARAGCAPTARAAARARCSPSAATAARRDTPRRRPAARRPAPGRDRARARHRPARCCCSTSPRPASRGRQGAACAALLRRHRRRRHRRAAGRARHGAGDGHLATRSSCSMPASTSPPARRPRCRPTRACARPTSANRCGDSARRRRGAAMPRRRRAARRRRAGRRLRRRAGAARHRPAGAAAARWWRCWAPTAPASRR